MTPLRRASDPPRRRLLRGAVAFLAAASFAVGGWGAVSVVRGSADLERLSSQLAAYQEARAAVRAESAALGKYAADRSREAGMAFVRARLRTSDALAAAEVHGFGGPDGILATRIAAAHRSYAASAHRLLSPAEAQAAQMARRALDERLAAAVVEARARTLEAAAAERRTERLALAGLPVSLLLLLALLLLSAGIRSRAAQQQELRRLTHAALTDSLTGLGNHRAFHEDMKRAIQHRNSSGARFSLMMVDLDGLKQVNDSLGHHAGDERIKEVADLLRSVVRSTDAAYRTGGDEFMVILPAERALGAVNLAQRLNEMTGTPGCRVSMTIGIAESVGLETKDALIRQADLALYEAKRTGRKVVTYSADLLPGAAKPSRLVRPNMSARVATALARAADARDPTTRAHGETVAELCALLAEQLGLDGATIARMRVAGLLHDVGKIGVPEAILQKAAPLDPAERAVIETHPLIGESIVAAAGFLDEARWIRHHHERFGGRGYPQGLRGREIPLESRIILVADAFEAITAGRPYRPALPAEEALAELMRNAGTQLDPECVTALRRALSLDGDAEQLVA